MYFAPELLKLLVQTILKYQITEQYFNEFADQPRNTEFGDPLCAEEEEDAGDADDDVAHYHDGDSHRADSAFAVMKSSFKIYFRRTYYTNLITTKSSIKLLSYWARNKRYLRSLTRV